MPHQVCERTPRVASVAALTWESANLPQPPKRRKIRCTPASVAARSALAYDQSPMYYLLKTEPDVYSFQQLQQEQKTVWDGVTNPVAVKNLREMHKGDKLIIYHTGSERRVAGTAQVLSVDAANPKVPLVSIAAGKPISKPAALSDIKESALFAGSPLLRQGRLSVVPLTEPQYKALVSGEL